MLQKDKNKKWSDKNVTPFWRRRRDLNPRAYRPTPLAGEPLHHLSTSPGEILYETNMLTGKMAEGKRFELLSLARSLVFKTSSLNHSDTPPVLLNNSYNDITPSSFCQQLLQKSFLDSPLSFGLIQDINNFPSSK